MALHPQQDKPQHERHTSTQMDIPQQQQTPNVPSVQNAGANIASQRRFLIRFRSESHTSKSREGTIYVRENVAHIKEWILRGEKSAF
jgi:hypothetical protein